MIESTEQFQSYKPAFQQAPNFLNVLKSIENEFNNNQYQHDHQNKIFKSSSTLFKENKFNQNNFVAHSYSSDNVNNLQTVDQTRQTNKIKNPDYNKRVQGYVDSRVCDLDSQQQQQQKEHMVLHVKNLDYKISADEWRRILTENFKKHCKDVKKKFIVIKKKFLFHYFVLER